MVHRFYALAEAAARALGRDPDRPRNLRKSHGDALMRIFVGARLFDGENFRDDCALVTEGERDPRDCPSRRAARRRDASISAAACWRRASSIGRSTAAAAFCSTISPTPETIRAIVAAHRRFGTTALAPTVITDAPEVLEAALEARAGGAPRLARRACRGAVHRSAPQGRASAAPHPRDDGGRRAAADRRSARAW